jgi:hypothetical protein
LLEKLIPEEVWERARRKGGWLGVGALLAAVGVVAYCEQRAVETAVHAAVTGCSESQESASRRAAQVFAAVVERYGPPTRELDDGDTLIFDAPRGPDAAPPRFELVLDDESMSDPCYWKVLVIAHVAELGEDGDKIKATLDDFDVRRSYERSGVWIHRHDGSLWAMKTASLREIHPSSFFWIDDHLSVAQAWASEWIGEVRDIAHGRAPVPKETVYRPGRDPQSVIESAKRFLRDAGIGD